VFLFGGVPIFQAGRPPHKVPGLSSLPARLGGATPSRSSSSGGGMSGHEHPRPTWELPSGEGGYPLFQHGSAGLALPGFWFGVTRLYSLPTRLGRPRPPVPHHRSGGMSGHEHPRPTWELPSGEGGYPPFQHGSAGLALPGNRAQGSLVILPSSTARRASPSRGMGRGSHGLPPFQHGSAGPRPPGMESEKTHAGTNGRT